MIKRFWSVLILVAFVACNYSSQELQKQFKQIDDEFSGNLGVYIKHLGNGKTVEYNAEDLWYLASTVKVPLAIAILQRIEDGELSLDDELTLKQTDMVDGTGEILWMEPGTKLTIRELLIRMIRESDSVAADMLMRLIGVDEFNEQIEEKIVAHGFEPITTILQVRYEAYGKLHENASKLSNMDYVRLKGVSPMDERLEEFIRVTGINRDELNAKSIPDAFELYYETRLNSAELESMGIMLERLVEGEYLNDKHTEFLLAAMKSVTTGNHRIKAGLPEGTVFAQKTGTQIGRACNVGIIYPRNNEGPIIVVACTEKYRSLNEAEETIEKVGHAISEYWLK